MGIFYATNVHLSVAVISALPTLAVLVAWIRRHSSAGSVPRFIWANGKSLLIVSAILNLLGILWSVTSRESISNLDLTQIVLSFSCLFYVLRSQRLRDTFLSFPALSESGGKQRWNQSFTASYFNPDNRTPPADWWVAVEELQHIPQGHPCVRPTELTLNNQGETRCSNLRRPLVILHGS